MVFLFFFSAFAGFLAKTADELENRFALLCGLLYGLILGYLASAEPLFAVVFLPAVLANLLAGKIDTYSHFLGFASFSAILLWRGIPAINPVFAALAFAAALLDEKVDLKLPYPRPFLPAAAAFISLLTASWTPLLVVLLFDSGYFVAENVWKKETEKEKSTSMLTAPPKKKLKKRASR